MLKAAGYENVHLLPSLFSDRAQVNRSYLMELENQGLLQNFYLEAGIVMPGLQVMEDPSKAALHWGWEAPTCQLRGHFTGHWMSAAAMLVMTNGDRVLKARLEDIIDELDKCRVLNGGKWIGSIPEKFFGKLERNEYVWSPQYVMHKTIMGLYHSYLYAKIDKALMLLGHAADWYLDWTEKMAQVNPHAVYSGEEGGMLEIWAGLYQATGDARYLALAERYSDPSIFRKLEAGLDPLSNCHGNASIPWAHGAARMFEITGDEKWLNRVRLFWDCAVNQREAYCTGGQGSGEYWVPPHLNGTFLGERNQEFCTVYNMVRLAEYLYRFTGDAVYADYIERNLYNGFLAQQNKETGTPTYFLPFKAGSKKKWGSKRHDFWCCHGTMVQAQTLYPTLCYYHDEAAEQLIVSQYIPSEYQWEKEGANITVRQSVDMKYYNAEAFFDESDDSQMSRWLMKLSIEAEQPTRFTLTLRVPGWVAGKPTVVINGEDAGELTVENGYIRLDREWHNDSIRIYFPAALTLDHLPDMPDTAAVLEGPIVLAGLCDADCGLAMEKDDPASALRFNTEHTYSTVPWQQSTYRTAGQIANFTFVPLYDVTDERYTVYFTCKERN
ncbi:MAG: glycoside hydrolase family 127 protein [Clostridia bacterium]|nr:glycoside hydrolase family 127 protein [Clostridia bacterium]